MGNFTHVQQPASTLYEAPEQIWRLFISDLLYLSDSTEKKEFGFSRYYQHQEIKFLLFDLYLIKDEVSILKKIVNPQGGFDCTNLLQKAKSIIDELVYCLKSCVNYSCFLTISDHKLALEVGGSGKNK